MSKQDYYETLGIQRGASEAEIKSAFRGLARKYHPDVSEEPNAEERFKQINEAYAVLSDNEKRAAYDRFGHAGVQGAGGVPNWSNMDFTDIFGDLGDIFGFPFGRAGGRMRNAPRQGADLKYRVYLSFEEAVFGVDKEIEITRDERCETCRGAGTKPGTSPTRCSTCGGRGEVRQTRQTILGSMVQVTTCPACKGKGKVIADPCPTCHGKGQVHKTRKKTITIPAGVDTGNQIRIAREGQPGINGGPSGNLYLMIQVEPHKYFRRRKNDILLDLNINIAQAALGDKIKVPTVDGEEAIRIPAGIQPGKVIRIRNKGIPHLRNNSRGDQLVVINVSIPKSLSDEQQDLFQQLAGSLGSEVIPQGRGFLDNLKDFISG
ncbi:MAG: molecular chaperone DnaJ [Chloroflexota bacterium]|nr:molecular chaperone DnaJ [Chloroflexota bacterium]